MRRQEWRPRRQQRLLPHTPLEGAANSAARLTAIKCAVPAITRPSRRIADVLLIASSSGVGCGVSFRGGGCGGSGAGPRATAAIGRPLRSPTVPPSIPPSPRALSKAADSLVSNSESAISGSAAGAEAESAAPARPFSSEPTAVPSSTPQPSSVPLPHTPPSQHRRTSPLTCHRAHRWSRKLRGRVRVPAARRIVCCWRRCVGCRRRRPRRRRPRCRRPRHRNRRPRAVALAVDPGLVCGVRVGFWCCTDSWLRSLTCCFCGSGRATFALLPLASPAARAAT